MQDLDHNLQCQKAALPLFPPKYACHNNLVVKIDNFWKQGFRQCVQTGSSFIEITEDTDICKYFWCDNFNNKYLRCSVYISSSPAFRLSVGFSIFLSAPVCLSHLASCSLCLSVVSFSFICCLSLSVSAPRPHRKQKANILETKRGGGGGGAFILG